jgi:hypothetical protein
VPRKSSPAAAPKREREREREIARASEGGSWHPVGAGRSWREQQGGGQ